MSRRRESAPDEQRLEAALAALAGDVEPLGEAELLMLARSASAAPPDRRLHVPSLGLAAATVIAATALAAAAVVIQSGGKGPSSRPSARERFSVGAWTWNQLPGEPTLVDLPVRVALARGGVPTRVHRVISVRAPGGRLTLLAAADAGGHVCFALRTALGVRAFHCVGPGARRAVVGFLGAKGPTTPRGARVAVLGVARSDVRAVAVAAGGRPSRLRLNRWRAFAWVGTMPAGSASLLVAYGSGDALLARIPLGSTMLTAVCGQAAATCSALDLPEDGLEGGVRPTLASQLNRA